MSRTRQPSTRRIGAAERAITVLDTLADGGELGTNEVARRTGMTPSTVSRQLGTLAASGLVERVASSGRYRHGVREVDETDSEPVAARRCNSLDETRRGQRAELAGRGARSHAGPARDFVRPELASVCKGVEDGDRPLGSANSTG